ncbi:MAG: HU family DNA-binding protein [bacterium]
MNNKEFNVELSQRLSLSKKESAELLKDFVDELTVNIIDTDGDVSFLSLGNFEVKEKGQKILLNPVSKLKMLIPPKLVLNFKPSVSLKSKYKGVI